MNATKVFRVELIHPDLSFTAMTIQRCLINHGHALPCEADSVTVTEITDPDELEVDDRVKTVAGSEGTITARETGYRIKGQAMTFCGLYTREQITKLPPEPTHLVEYENDRLNLIRLASEATGAEYVCDHVDMGDPAKVEKVIVSWVRNIGIDADDVRRRIAVPTVIATRVIGTTANCGAVRYADGWRVFITDSKTTDARFIDGRLQPEDLARVLFPEINGPYFAETP